MVRHGWWRGAGWTFPNSEIVNESLSSTQKRQLLTDITGVPVDVAALEGNLDGISIADGTTGGVNDPSTLLDVFEGVGVDQVTGTFVERAVDGDDITLRKEFLITILRKHECVYANSWALHYLEVKDTSDTNLGGSVGGEGVVVVVEQFLGVKGNKALKDTVTNATSTNGSNDFALEIVSVAGNVGDVPVTPGDHLVCGGVVSDQDEDTHDNVLSACKQKQ